MKGDIGAVAERQLAVRGVIEGESDESWARIEINGSLRGDRGAVAWT